MTCLVLPQMVNKQKGLIINIGSFSGCITLPFYGVYPATKVNFENKWKQEAFRERRHLYVCDLWSWGVTLTLRQDKKKAYVIRCRLLCLGSRYDVCGSNTLWDMTICSFMTFIVTFDLHLWPSASVKVTWSLTIFVVCWYQVWNL